MRPNDPRAIALIRLVREVFEKFSTLAERLAEIHRVVPPDLQPTAKIYLVQMQTNEAKRTSSDDHTKTGENEDFLLIPVASEDLLGGYRRESVLKDGTFAQVLLCRSLYGNQTAVVKYQPPLDEAPATTRRISRTLAESQALFGLNHPNIVRIFASGYVQGPHKQRWPYISMEYVEGESLMEWFPMRVEQLKGQSRCKDNIKGLPAREAATIIAILCDAIQVCHDRGILHMDLSFNNVMVAKSESNEADEKTLKIIDFGAAAVNFVDPGGTTLAFVDPDCLTHDHIPAVADDIFALGCLLYYLLTGDTPNIERNAVPVDILALKDADPILQLLVRRALARRGIEASVHPSDARGESANGQNSPDRYGSAHEMACELRNWANDYPVERLAHLYGRNRRFGMLVNRCQDQNRVEDHSLLIAYAFFIMAGNAFLWSTLSLALTLAGMAPNTASTLTLIPYVGASLAAIATVAWISRNRAGTGFNRLAKTTGQMFAAMAAYIFAFVVYATVLCEGDPARGGGFQFLMTALLVVYVGLWKPEWNVWNRLGWVFLVLSIPAGWAARQSWYPSVYPIFQAWQQGAFFLVFASNAAWKAKNSPNRRLVTPTVSAPENHGTASASA